MKRSQLMHDPHGKLLVKQVPQTNVTVWTIFVLFRISK
jgi:hypothetical protein